MFRKHPLLLEAQIDDVEIALMIAWDSETDGEFVSFNKLSDLFYKLQKAISKFGLTDELHNAKIHLNIAVSQYLKGAAWDNFEGDEVASHIRSSLSDMLKQLS